MNRKNLSDGRDKGKNGQYGTAANHVAKRHLEVYNNFRYMIFVVIGEGDNIDEIRNG